MSIKEQSLQVTAKEVDNFLESSIGRYMVERVGHDLEHLRDQMENINPWWPGALRKMRKLKTEMIAVRKMNSYLYEIVTLGVELEEIE